MNDTLFEMPEAKPAPLVLRADRPVYNYRRIQKGQNLKVNLRDCSTGKIVGTIYGGERMAAQIVAAVNEKQETMMGRGDCAKMRKAVRSLMDNMKIHLLQPIEQITINRAELEAMIKDCSEALAAPERNCDVGMAEEQAERYGRYCDKFTSDGMHCETCPCCGKIPFGKCEFAWAQMPYKEGGNNVV